MKNFEDIHSPDVLVSRLLKLLFEMLDKAYNKRIEPYLAIAMSVNIPLFIDEVEADGFICLSKTSTSLRIRQIIRKVIHII